MTGTARRLAALVGLAGLPVLVLGAFFVLPVSSMIGLGLWPDGQWDPAPAWEALRRERTLRVLWFTVWAAGVATVATVLLGVPTAYALHRLAVPGARVIRTILMAPFVLPTVVVGVAFDQLLGVGGPLAFLGWDGTPWSIIAAMVFFNLAVVVRTVGTAWESLDPRPGQAAAALGATPWQVFRVATWPALRGSVVSAATVVFLFCATSFGVVLVLGGMRHATIETEIYLLTTVLFDLPAAAALCLLQFAVVVLLLAVAQRARKGQTTGQRVVARPKRPGLVDLPAVLVAVAGALLVLVPISSLVARSFRVGEAWSLDNYRRLSAADDPAIPATVTEALVNSLRVAFDATWMAVLLGLLVALAVTRRSHGPAERRLRGLLDGLFMLPLGVSAVTLGFGFFIALDEPPLDLRDSPLLVPIAQALVALPLVVRILVPVLAGIDDRQRQAAASLGAPAWRTFLAVDLAVVWQPLLAATGFAFTVSLGEFGATSFLARSEHPTLPVLIFKLLGTPGAHHYGTAVAASVVLAAVTATALVLVERLRVPGVGGF
ncbi:ABC transporter permease [Nocardioides alcanivorans]|uniref:ABC transporter permease n=1 Tax=Nocardioides alcanivorans TaxID=2897352 RepID=UPI001F3C47EF|nr:iron ABC transporter permease [Nocardioides alcanivorans]